MVPFTYSSKDLNRFIKVIRPESKNLYTELRIKIKILEVPGKISMLATHLSLFRFSIFIIALMKFTPLPTLSILTLTSFNEFPLHHIITSIIHVDIIITPYPWLSQLVRKCTELPSQYQQYPIHSVVVDLNGTGLHSLQTGPLQANIQSCRHYAPILYHHHQR